MNTACSRCLEGATGETGHADLKLYVTGPYPGHHIFQCTKCDERWIRHAGAEGERYGWTLYSTQFTTRKVKPTARRVVVAPS